MAADTPQALAAREALRAKWSAEPAPIRWEFQGGLWESKAEHPFTGRIFVLVDRYSGSSGESAPWALKNALGATLVGERTRGCWKYGNQATYVLPNTGTRWQLSTKKNVLEQPVESVGNPVDVYLEAPAAPIEDILPLLGKRR